jgi:hypothetical protein
MAVINAQRADGMEPSMHDVKILMDSRMRTLGAQNPLMSRGIILSI